ncbi:low-density lipoprotein receptor class A domain-containing protein 3 [Lates japonicus]|uniref:Low-density lipoprotein receptor class A domain-containing protein 3 n=1 Tax=Lates japonicus TaxID=270547 RepID=A0AAD3M7C6_LATJO|nr:low-density lipoprotein receptor class A domain-containing protein 3 [Lates japonicus]
MSRRRVAASLACVAGGAVIFAWWWHCWPWCSIRGESLLLRRGGSHHHHHQPCCCPVWSSWTGATSILEVQNSPSSPTRWARYNSTPQALQLLSGTLYPSGLSMDSTSRPYTLAVRCQMGSFRQASCLHLRSPRPLGHPPGVSLDLFWTVASATVDSAQREGI